MCHKPSTICALSNGISYVIIAPAVFENTAENARSAKGLLFYIYSQPSAARCPLPGAGEGFLLYCDDFWTLTGRVQLALWVTPRALRAKKSHDQSQI